MYSQTTQNYNLPQWQNNDKPTWLGDMNDAFDKIDRQMKQNHDDAIAGGVPQEVLDRITALETGETSINEKIGTDVISSIGSSITNAIVNIKSNIDTLTQNLANATTNIATITTQIGTDVITGIGTSITNAIVNLKSSIDSALNSIASITTRLGNTDISDVSATITGAIRNLADSGGGEVPPEVLNRITTLETKVGTDNISGIGNSITNAIVNLKSNIDTLTQNLATATTNIATITTQIGTDAITGIGTSITNAIVNLNTLITTINTKLGSVDISDVGASITQAIRNLANSVDSASIVLETEIPTSLSYNNKIIYKKYYNKTITIHQGAHDGIIDSGLNYNYIDKIISMKGTINYRNSGQVIDTNYTGWNGLTIFSNLGLLLSRVENVSSDLEIEIFCEVEYTKQ